MLNFDGNQVLHSSLFGEVPRLIISLHYLQFQLIWIMFTEVNGQKVPKRGKKLNFFKC